MLNHQGAAELLVISNVVFEPFRQTLTYFHQTRLKLIVDIEICSVS